MALSSGPPTIFRSPSSSAKEQCLRQLGPPEQNTIELLAEAADISHSSGVLGLRRRSKTRVPVRSVSAEGSLPGLHMVTFLLCPQNKRERHGEGEGEREGGKEGERESTQLCGLFL